MISTPWPAIVLCIALFGWPLIILAQSIWTARIHRRMRAAALALLSKPGWDAHERRAIILPLQHSLQWKYRWAAPVAVPLLSVIAAVDLMLPSESGPYAWIDDETLSPEDRRDLNDPRTSDARLSEISQNINRLVAEFELDISFESGRLFQEELYWELWDKCTTAQIATPQTIASMILLSPLLLLVGFVALFARAVRKSLWALVQKVAPGDEIWAMFLWTQRRLRWYNA